MVTRECNFLPPQTPSPWLPCLPTRWRGWWLRVARQSRDSRFGGDDQSVRISPELCKRNADGGRYGAGVAVCQNMLVISSCDRLQVFALPDDIVAIGVMGTPRDLTHVRTLGGVAPMEFQFSFFSGYLAFTDGCDEATTALLLVTDGGGRSCCGAVHVIDVVHGTHMGYVAAPGTIRWPRGVTTRKSLAASSCWNSVRSVRSVRVFEGSGGTWTAVRMIDPVASPCACGSPRMV